MRKNIYKIRLQPIFMKCRGCNKNLSAKSNFCIHCGLKVSKEDSNPEICHKCGKKVSLKADYCVHCGSKIKREVKLNYCHKCGADLKEAAEEASADPRSSPSALNIIIKVVFILLVIEFVFFLGWYLFF